MAAEYHLINSPATGVIRASDGKWIHQDADVPNKEWTEYQEWLAAGNVPDGPDMPTGGATGTAHAAAPSGAAAGAKAAKPHG